MRGVAGQTTWSHVIPFRVTTKKASWRQVLMLILLPLRANLVLHTYIGTLATAGLITSVTIQVIQPRVVCRFKEFVGDSRRLWRGRQAICVIWMRGEGGCVGIHVRRSWLKR